MNNRISTVLYLLILISFGACNLFEPVQPQSGIINSSDSVKISVVKFSIRHLTSSEEWTYFPGDNVDITSFRNIDSVRFAANMRSQGYDELCIVELYDFTNERSVRYSTVDSNVRFYFKYVESFNIFPDFPKEEVLMGIRMRSSKKGNFVEVGYDSEIIIYSH